MCSNALEKYLNSKGLCDSLLFAISQNNNFIVKELLLLQSFLLLKQEAHDVHRGLHSALTYIWYTGGESCIEWDFQPRSIRPLSIGSHWPDGAIGDWPLQDFRRGQGHLAPWTEKQTLKLKGPAPASSLSSIHPSSVLPSADSDLAP